MKWATSRQEAAHPISCISGGCLIRIGQSLISSTCLPHCINYDGAALSAVMDAWSAPYRLVA
eukprot:6214725-Pleurochrysis_carterae.AAC.4